MTAPQLTAFVVIILMMAAFIWGRIRYDLVATAALVVSVLVGIVPADKAFSGFSSDIVIIVGSALVVSAAVSRSRVMDILVQRLTPNVTSPRLQLIILTSVVAALATFVKNIGALAIMIPIATQMARRSSVSVSMFLMPMSFAALLGGLVTLVGTSPNIIVSEVRMALTGTPFNMFDFAPVGLVLTVTGLVFLATFYWLLPKRQREGVKIDEVISIKNYMTEATVRRAAGKTVSEVQKPGGGRAMVTAIIGRNGGRRRPLPDAELKEGDRLLIEGESEALDRIVDEAPLEMTEVPAETRADLTTVEAIIGPGSFLIGSTADEIAMGHTTGLNLLAVARRDQRLSQGLGKVRFEAGDVIIVQGAEDTIGDRLRELDCLPLVSRKTELGSVRNRLIPLAILLVAMVTAASGLLPIAFVFFAAAALMIALRTVPLRDAYRTLDGPILVMIAALIPVSDALRTTGVTEIIAGLLSQVSAGLPPAGMLALIIVAAMAITPFLNNAATVLVMAPIAASFATSLGLRPEAFLMAVAIGAGCDFLTPIGHQCNTLVMGPGGYRFGDYWRLGLPLSVIVIIVSVFILPIVWPIS